MRTTVTSVTGRRRRLPLVAVPVLLILLGAAWYGQFWLRRCSAPQLIGEAIRRIDTPELLVALTFDDGPNPPYTDQILEVLDRYQAKATFFVVGRFVKAYPETMKEIAARGHEIGNHSWSHERLVYRSASFILDQILRTDAAIRETGYSGTIHFRAPFGHKLLMLPFLLKRMNRPHILWNIELGDWEELPPAEMLRRLDAELRPGSIILLHDGDAVPKHGVKGSRRNTVELTRLALQKYQALGYRFVTISELLACRKSR